MRNSVFEKINKCVEEINLVIVHVRKSHKNIKTEKTRAKYANKLLTSLNTIIITAQDNDRQLSKVDKKNIEKIWTLIKENCEITLERLKVKAPLTASIFENSLIKLLEEDGTNSDPKDDLEVEDNLGDEDTIIIVDMDFDMKAANSLLGTFDGTPDKLEHFVTRLEILDETTAEIQQTTLLRFAKTCLTGKALNVGRAATTIDELASLLRAHCLPTVSADAIEMKLKSTKQTGNALEFTEKIEELTEKLAAQYIAEGMSPTQATKFANKAGVENLIQNARNSQTKFLMRAGNFTSLTEATTKILKEDTAPGEVAQILGLKSYRGGRHHGGRGGNRGGRGGYGSRGGRGNRGSRGGRGRNVRAVEAEQSSENGSSPQLQLQLGAQQ